MRKLVVLFISAMCLNASAQDVVGSWHGTLKTPQGISLRLIFNITKADNGYTTTMDSPDQGAKGIPVTSTTFENNALKLSIPGAGIAYEGQLEGETITGDFKQAGMTFPLNMSRKAVEYARPQMPTRPLPYYEEEVTFENKDAGIKLSGTLTLPSKEGQFPVVVLISGSGPQNRDEELMGHKPFLVLSDYLTRNGIAVLRYDDRGVGASTGDFKSATTIDFASDTEAAVAFLKTRKEIDKKKIGLIGHSEGGMIAPMVAGKLKSVAFIVLLAGPGIPGDQILLAQQALIGRASGVNEVTLAMNSSISKGGFDLVKATTEVEKLKTELGDHLKKYNLPEASIPPAVEQMTSPWMINFIKYDPAPALEKVKCPVLALNGEKDLQVPPKENLGAIQTALAKAGNKKVKTKELPRLNHLFQECKSGLPSEYSSIEQTFSPLALEEIGSWIKEQVR